MAELLARGIHSIHEETSISELFIEILDRDFPAAGLAGSDFRRRKEAMDQIIVEAAPRETRGKNAARRMRVAGKVPALFTAARAARSRLR